MSEKVINSIYEEDLKEYLRNLGLLERMEKGELKCAFCDKIINLQNIGCIFPQKDDIKVSCDRKECFDRVIWLWQQT